MNIYKYTSFGARTL